ncbi:CatB-related O-acetyltransferase [Agrobacterium sp. a22-2]|uniref:CatB-related O-acetyltransferase n=1 Tax=Agrobacterium sp. a22-2 TaxID=2283840 RepID=UPI001AEED168|nr:CatB-related O-acetyltransferase [Agrobacterium sp. a22-2]
MNYDAIAKEISSDDTLTKYDDVNKLKRNGIRLRTDYEIAGSLRLCRGTSANGMTHVRGVAMVGRYCALGRGLSMVSGNHRTDMANQQIWLQDRLSFESNVSRGTPIVVGHNVWTGLNVTILSGVRVGHGAVIAASSVVTKDVPPFAIMAGVPAKLVRYRFSEHVRTQMLKAAWWHWDEQKMQRNKAFFEVQIGPDDKPDLLALIVK